MPYRPLWKSLVSEARGGKGLVLAIDAALRDIWGVINSIISVNIISGSSRFSGFSGVIVLIGDTLTGTDYSVVITPTGAAENVGAVHVSNKTTTTFTVYCTGTGIPTFDWVLIDNN